jgi:hypothetical protein
LKGALAFSRRLHLDYIGCLKDKAVADRHCSTWEETVERAAQIFVDHGILLNEIKKLMPELLTETEMNQLT